jgi:hypothetical protein
MSEFFKSLFNRSSRRTEPSPPQQGSSISYEQLEGMPFQEVLALVKSLPVNAQSRNLTAFVRRFYNIALYDNHVPQEHREAALKLAEALTADLEKALAANPEALAALKNANSQMIENTRRGGYGSLMWKLEEYSISGADTIPYVMKPEHRHLVPDFLEIIRPQTVAEAKHHWVRQLVLQSGYNSNNSVLILHGLAAKGDKGAAVLFTPDEYRALLNVPDNTMRAVAFL